MILYFLFIAPALLLAVIAQARVKSAFHRWSQVQSRTGLTGAQVAQRVLDHGGTQGVRIEATPGKLTDHYDPRGKVLRLSEANYHGRSVAAAAVAAHEAGHAIQHAREYGPLVLRSLAVPAANFGSGLSFPLLIIGAIMSFPPLILAGVVLFSFVVLFQLITLPVEFDASRRAKLVLADSGIIVDEEEARGVSNVLNAAALTYVAAAAQAVLTLMYYVIVFLGNRR